MAVRTGLGFHFQLVAPQQEPARVLVLAEVVEMRQKLLSKDAPKRRLLLQLNHHYHFFGGVRQRVPRLTC